jgi:hypothetical protein
VKVGRPAFQDVEQQISEVESHDVSYRRAVVVS